jgi:hypothetical protein
MNKGELLSVIDGAIRPLEGSLNAIADDIENFGIDFNNFSVDWQNGHDGKLGVKALMNEMIDQQKAQADALNRIADALENLNRRGCQ